MQNTISFGERWHEVEETPFGRYQLIELLGRGGMGNVYRAHDSVTDRAVAIKVLTENLSEDRAFQQRFRREAHAAARLDTPHVVPIYDYGEIDGRLFVSMRLINGRDLGAVLADGPLDPARAVRIVDQVAKALHAAHKAGLLHRDVKPSNILLDDDDFAYLIDFGIAHAVGETRMTVTGGMIGTFAYIAPERLDSDVEEDARADIYSLACVLCEALTGLPPFRGSSPAHLIAAHLNSPPPQPSSTRPDVPSSIDEVIATGMAKKPEQRYATSVELAVAAREAITVPTHRPGTLPERPAPTHHQSPSSATNDDAAAPTMAAPFATAPTQHQHARVAASSTPPAQGFSYAHRATTTSPSALPSPPKSHLTAIVVAAATFVAVVAIVVLNAMGTFDVAHQADTSTSTTKAPTVSKRDVEGEINAKLTDANGNKPDSVNCPGDLPAKVGAQLDCQMKVKGEKYNVNVTVTSVVGKDVKFDMAETLDKVQVASIISDKLYQQVGQRPDTVTCPDNLKGYAGATLRCQLTDGASKYGITVTVTSVSGGDVNFDFRVDDQPS